MFILGKRSKLKTDYIYTIIKQNNFMKAVINRKKLTVTVTGILNESLSDDVTFAADQAKCSYETYDYSTKIIVRCPTEKHLDKFISEYNK